MKIWMDIVREDLKDKHINLTGLVKRPASSAVSTLMEDRKEEED